jgi:hypothetical protein
MDIVPLILILMDDFILIGFFMMLVNMVSIYPFIMREEFHQVILNVILGPQFIKKYIIIFIFRIGFMMIM